MKIRINHFRAPSRAGGCVFVWVCVLGDTELWIYHVGFVYTCSVHVGAKCNVFDLLFTLDLQRLSSFEFSNCPRSSFAKFKLWTYQCIKYYTDDKLQTHPVNFTPNNHMKIKLNHINYTDGWDNSAPRSQASRGEHRHAEGHEARIKDPARSIRRQVLSHKGPTPRREGCPARARNHRDLYAIWYAVYAIRVYAGVWPYEGTGLIMPCAKFTSAERYLCEALRPYPRIVDHPLWPVPLLMWDAY